MLTAAEFIQAGITQLHRSLDRAVADLTPEQLHAVPGGHPKANTIAFEIWHLVRTEDNVVRFVIQNRRPTVWAEGKYAESEKEYRDLLRLRPEVPDPERAGERGGVKKDSRFALIFHK